MLGKKKWVTVQQWYLPTRGSIIHLKDMSTTLMMEGLDLENATIPSYFVPPREIYY